MIDLTIHEKGLKKAIERAKERNVIIPTFKQMKDPDRYTPDKIKERLKNTGLWDVDPVNLFRITWKNEPKKQGGLFGKTNYVEIPREVTGVNARIVAIVGVVPDGSPPRLSELWPSARLVTGQFDPLPRRPYGPPRATIAVAAPITPSFLGANPLPYCLKA